jgi:hypothetical protein
MRLQADVPFRVQMSAKPDDLTRAVRKYDLRIGERREGRDVRGLLNIAEIPVECGLVEIGVLSDEERESMLSRSGKFVHFDENHCTYCRVTVLPAPWRETPGPTWQFVCKYGCV